MRPIGRPSRPVLGLADGIARLGALVHREKRDTPVSGQRPEDEDLAGEAGDPLRREVHDAGHEPPHQPRGVGVGGRELRRASAAGRRARSRS